MKLQIDRKSAIPIHQQLKGAIEHEIAFGTLRVGSPLPSVRDLAEQVGVAPMTVSKVYGDLKVTGLIKGRTGSGTFVSEKIIGRTLDRGTAHRLRKGIDAVVDLALQTGLPRQDVLSMITTRAAHRLGTGRRGDVVMVGLFSDATESYARCVEEQVGHLAKGEPVTLDQLNSDPALRARVAEADLLLTFSTLEEDISALALGAQVISLRFIPAEETRLALASHDTMSRLGVVSRFAGFLPILSLGVRRFAAHVLGVTGLTLDDPELRKVLADCDVLVLSTGADSAVDHALAGARVI